jgi:hypothetical protein
MTDAKLAAPSNCIHDVQQFLPHFGRDCRDLRIFGGCSAHVELARCYGGGTRAAFRRGAGLDRATEAGSRPLALQAE